MELNDFNAYGNVYQDDTVIDGDVNIIVDAFVHLINTTIARHETTKEKVIAARLMHSHIVDNLYTIAAEKILTLQIKGHKETR